MVIFVVAEILTQKTYQLFFPYILWDKYPHTPILLMVILSSKKAFIGVKINFHFQIEVPLRITCSL